MVFTFRGDNEGKCFLKHTKDVSTQKQETNAISGPPYCGIFPNNFQYIIMYYSLHCKKINSK